MANEKSKKIKMHILYKADGTDVRVNDNSLSHGLSIGWTKESPEEKEAKAAAKKQAKKDAETKAAAAAEDKAKSKK